MKEQFQSTPSVGRATISCYRQRVIPLRFQSTPSVGRATRERYGTSRRRAISIHALRGEGDDELSSMSSIKYISIHALRGEGDKNPSRLSRMPGVISIHALRGEGDLQAIATRVSTGDISIHALRGEGDGCCAGNLCENRDFNPRPPWGGRLVESDNPYAVRFISIHALRGEGDTDTFGAASRRVISIHALRGEGDRVEGGRSQAHKDFNPRPPWGGRPLPQSWYTRLSSISIHALRGEGDHGDITFGGGTGISIHALRGEGDYNECAKCVIYLYFNPRPPWGGRPAQTEPGGTICRISIHALRGEGDRCSICRWSTICNFNPRPPWGGRLFCPVFELCEARFQSTPSVGRATRAYI